MKEFYYFEVNSHEIKQKHNLKRACFNVRMLKNKHSIQFYKDLIISVFMLILNF